MITINSDTPYLGISFAEVLDIDIIQNLKEGFGMMGMRFTGKPNKAAIVKAYDEYVKTNPADVLRCLRPEELEMVNEILKQGKGGYVTVEGIELYNQLQKMNLVLTREDEVASTSDLYLIDELHDLFAPHIDAVIKHPVDYDTDETQKTPLDAVIFEVSSKCNEIVGHNERWTRTRPPKQMSRKERADFSDALFEYGDVLDEYEGKLTSLIAVMPQGFGRRQADVQRMENTIKSVRDIIDHTQTLIEAIEGSEIIDGRRTDSPEDIDPEEKAQLEKVLNSQEFKDVIDLIQKDRMASMEAARKAEKEGCPFKRLPAFTKHPAKYPAMKESYCATRLVRPRIFEITLPLEDDLYFIVYFIYMEQHGYTQATCYWGNVFDFAQRAATELYPGAGYVMLSKPFRKKYPHVAAVYGMHEDNQDCTKPYLTTIGWEGQPKEWYLSMRLYDFDYTKLITFSPLDCPEVIEAIDTLHKTALSLVSDIHRSDAKSPKLLVNELFGL